MKKLLMPVLVLLLLGLLAFGLLRSDEQGNPMQGKAAPTFKLQSLTGQTFDLAALKGKPVLINFWATWCVPCRNEAGVLSEMAARTRGKVQFLGILFNDSPEKAKEFMQEYGVNFVTLQDQRSQTAIDYGVGQIPITYIVDAEGNIAFVHLGEITRPVLEEQFKKLGVEL